MAALIISLVLFLLGVARADLRFDVFSDAACADLLASQTYPADVCVNSTGGGKVRNATEYAACVLSAPPLAFLTCRNHGSTEKPTTFEQDEINGDYFLRYGFVPCGEGAVSRLTVNYCYQFLGLSYMLSDTQRTESGGSTTLSASSASTTTTMYI